MYENKYNIKINYKIINFQNFLLSKHLFVYRQPQKH